MKRSPFLYAALAAALSLGACSGDNQRTDGTAGEAVSNMDNAATDGGVQSDAVVIDNNAGPTVTPNADSAAQTGSNATTTAGTTTGAITAGATPAGSTTR